ncbi:TPA: hypothetical protein DD425_02700 [Candidatus Saccharibacteria bacterium]|nr:hypothetical protein [Candidatus Saccharibacteria bacterium]
MSLLLELLRWASAIILITLCIACIAIVSKRPIGKNTSVSLHISSNSPQFLSMAIFLTIAGAVFYTFIWVWLIPKYSLPPLLYPVLVVAYLGQLLLSWYPASMSNSKSHKLHTTGGVVVAVGMLLVLLTLCLDVTKLPFLVWVYVTIGTISTGILLVLYAIQRKVRDYFLIFELLFIAFFCSVILLLIIIP